MSRNGQQGLQRGLVGRLLRCIPRVAKMLSGLTSNMTA
jgi:hypothetical protein